MPLRIWLGPGQPRHNCRWTALSRTASSVHCAVMVSPAPLSVKDSLSNGQSCGQRPACSQREVRRKRSSPPDRTAAAGAATARTPGTTAHTRGRTAPHTGGVRNSGAGERPAVVPPVPMWVVTGTPSERRHTFRPSLAAARCRVTPIILQPLPCLRQEHDALPALRRADFGVRHRYLLRHSPCILSSCSRRPRYKGAQPGGSPGRFRECHFRSKYWLQNATH